MQEAIIGSAGYGRVRPDHREWAQKLLDTPDLVIWDAHTTGLGHFDEIVELALINKAGEILFDSMVRPTQPIPPSASRIHGIYNETAANAPSIDAVYAELCELVPSKTVLAWSGEFDARILGQSLRNTQIPLTARGPIRGVKVESDPLNRYYCEGWTFIDLMFFYADAFGKWNSRHYSYNLVGLPGKGERALHNARMTLEALLELANYSSRAKRD